jgi:hypothetical protein
VWATQPLPLSGMDPDLAVLLGHLVGREQLISGCRPRRTGSVVDLTCRSVEELLGTAGSRCSQLESSPGRSWKPVRYAAVGGPTSGGQRVSEPQSGAGYDRWPNPATGAIPLTAVPRDRQRAT